jgi:hypothetical protein
MKNLFKVLAFGAMLAASSSLAFASPLNGTVTIDGGTHGDPPNKVGAITPGTLSSSTSSITFTSGLEYTLGGSGSFATGIGPAPGFEPVTFVTTFTIPTFGNPFAPENLFTFNYNNGSTTVAETFAVTDVTTGANGSLYFYGTILGNPGNAVYILTPNTDGSGAFSSTLTVAPTPEPSSLILLGTGLVGAAGLMFRKRRTVKA